MKKNIEEGNAYILGTEELELFRLGIQHQVWASEAQKGWELAGFKPGDTILDLGSGPGFASKELSFITGVKGQVIAVDKSQAYIDYIDRLSDLHNLNIKAVQADFGTLELEENSLDGMYCRWAMAWIPNVEEVLEMVYKALKPGAKMVIQEYYDWSTHQIEPSRTYLSKCIKAALKSFKESEGEIDIGRYLPGILSNLGMTVLGARPMAKFARPGNLVWNWPKSFYEVYFPKLVTMGLLNEGDPEKALQELSELEQLPGSTLFCPTLIEVIAQK